MKIAKCPCGTCSQRASCLSSASYPPRQANGTIKTRKLAGSIANPANEIVACRRRIRKRRLAPAAPPPGCTATCACYGRHAYPDPTNAAATTAAAADAASARSASTAAATTTASAGAAASATATASTGELHAAKRTFFFVQEEMEGGEADVGKFFFTELDHHAG